jgi:argonaute-like protein implicated in RNA metabolism and viral defense
MKDLSFLNDLSKNKVKKEYDVFEIVFEDCKCKSKVPTKDKEEFLKKFREKTPKTLKEFQEAFDYEIEII